MKRIVGIVMLLVALLGLLIAVGGVLVSRTVVDGLGSSLDTTLTLAGDSLDTVGDTLQLTKTSVNQAGSSLDTLAETALNVSKTMSDTQPLMNKVTETATQRIPDSIEAIQKALPDVAEAAGVIDETMRVLDNFALDRQVFGIPLQFDLGIDYQPRVPLDATVLSLGGSLDGVPEELRALESDMVQATENLALVGGNVETIGDDLDLISQTVAEINPLLDQYLDIVDQTKVLLSQAQSDLNEQLGMLQLAITALFVWLGLNQLVPLYLGWTLMTGADVTEEEVREAAEKVVAEASKAAADDDGEGKESGDKDESEADERS
ncbi:MAG: hypothetical protein PVH65_07340 [Chloroflexota bacterium]|jgi:hypothetical protein